ncbi:UDP-N-acetylglucosamine:LPS N-acetylglucosamine transferase [Nostoc piscinale CENA21]|uniref:UDP-N-acetylglucosamine:LPS N-acetylglucosamine transferase n=1 Tax=Nostoc piscinale CENA21 TaxID=224013 RepID=A0A0M4SZY2_9NOSO|nr:glycosyltransferase [Nostoc piscinale]ALF52132.1 UDP-N-acetylglucosamine:LPS N-acetylglucosamine transferase [Nostoc piscinale CENA21]
MTNTWLIYALGGGWGHLNRALALGRIAAKERKVTIITNSPYALKINHENCIVNYISEQAGFFATCQQVREFILNTQCDRLIIDTFPRGLGGELADILPQLQPIPRILIHRDISPDYVTAKNLRSFVAQNYDKVIVPGEGQDLPLADLPNVQHTAPWLIRNCEELPDKMSVRSHIFKVNPDIPTILVCAAGNASELSFFARLTLHLQQNFPHCAVRILAANCPTDIPEALWISHHPGIECLAAADVVVGGAGYNTVYECAAVGVPLVAFAFKRLYDRQAKRANQVYRVKNLPQAITTVSTLLDRIELVENLSIPSYINGTFQALHYISA